MNPRTNTSKAVFLTIILLLISFTFVQQGCRKTITITEKPTTNFTDLKIDPTFEFDNFKKVDATITISNSKATGMNIVQIYQGNPAQGGKLITTGALNSQNQFVSSVRLPARLSEVYIGNVASDGFNEYVAVPIQNNALSYDFGRPGGGIMKSIGAVSANDCSSGCTNTITGWNYSITINSGEVYCVDEGTSATINKLKVNSGGTLKICGTATVNKYHQGGGDGTIIVTPSGTLTLPKYSTDHEILNYGSLNISGGGTNNLNGSLHNWGTVNISIKFINKGTITNDGSFTVTNDFTNDPGAEFTNNCSMYVTENGNNAFKQNSTFTNNGYVWVEGEIDMTGSSTTYLGLNSLMVSEEDVSIEGDIIGPNEQGAQIKSEDEGQTSGGSSITGYVDLCIDDGLSPNNGYKGPNVTYCSYTIPVPNCIMPFAPTITSSLVGGGLVNQPITPYVITATGSSPITYNATNLPAGLTYNAANHTISGTPTTAGVTNITLVADNYMGTDTKTLVFTVTQPVDPPVITSALTGSTTVNQAYNYQLTASGTGPITYNATNLPAALSFNSTTNQITGIPTSAGTYNITLTATNSAGTDTETLVLTVGSPPEITSALTASGTVDQQFSTYTLTATGNPTITYNAVNLPPGLVYNSANHTIAGTPTNPGITEVTLTATNGYGSDTKILTITIEAGIIAPEITSALTAVGEANQGFSYEITTTGTEPVTVNATNLPTGLSLNGNIISGIPTIPGTYNISLSASNAAGTDNETLVLTILAAGSTTDTDGDGVMDNLDAYPTDPTRAFNSYYPNQADFGSVAFEDLWPAYGDYDCNDLVMDFQYQIVTNAQNLVVDLILRYQVMAAGASLNNGFGIVLNTLSSNVESVTGCVNLGNAVTLDPKGFEIGHTDKTVVIPVDAVNSLLGTGMVNTIIGGNTVQTSVDTVTIHFGIPQATIGTPPYNPFIFVNQTRSYEIHLKDEPPTDMADPDYFGTYNDASDPALGYYYRSSTGLPWAFEIPISFDYPVESVDILQAYLHFAEWAESSGALYPDWYMNESGYRNEANIY
jgi:LruC domain-containing protein